jgi:hypothetical protein
LKRFKMRRRLFCASYLSLKGGQDGHMRFCWSP